nr:glycosyltransferase [Spirochaetota bacterium]
MKSIMILGLNRSETPDGVTRHAANLALALNRIPHIKKIYLVVGVWQRDYFINSFGVISDKIEIIPINIENSMKNRNLWYIFQFHKIIKKYLPDLVHFAFPMPFLKKNISAPVVTTIHDLYPYDIPENFGFPKVLFNKYFLKEAIKKSDGLICVSKNTQKRLFDLFPKTNGKKNSVIYNYVDFDKVEPLLPKELEKYSEINFILCVGQHRKNKNIDVAVRAFKKLTQEKKIEDSMSLIIAGAKGPETNSIISLIDELGLKDRVTLLYSLTDKNLNWLYKNCKVNVC